MFAREIIVNSTRSRFVHRRSIALLPLLLLAATVLPVFAARADTLVDVGFEVFGPFSKDTDANSNADLQRWTMDGLGLTPLHGNPRRGHSRARSTPRSAVRGRAIASFSLR